MSYPIKIVFAYIFLVGFVAAFLYWKDKERYEKFVKWYFYGAFALITIVFCIVALPTGKKDKKKVYVVQSSLVFDEKPKENSLAAEEEFVPKFKPSSIPTRVLKNRKKLLKRTEGGRLEISFSDIELPKKAPERKYVADGFVPVEIELSSSSSDEEKVYSSSSSDSDDE